ncbi:MAG TPA: tetratricopeptide repeat protein [Terriglobales bacterium]
MARHWLGLVVLLPALAFCTSHDLQDHTSEEQVRVTPPGLRHADPPPANATVDELTDRAQQLEGDKAFADAIDYYQAALNKDKRNAGLYNHLGIVYIKIQHYPEAQKAFVHAIKFNPDFADAHNNLGVVRYEDKKYGKAIDEYQKAIQVRPDCASFYSNLGAAFFMKKEWESATQAYSHALQLDPDIFTHSARIGVTAQLPSPQDRAKFDYVIARLFAKNGDPDRSLQYLRRSMEEGYKGINGVYKDPEFTTLREDPRFTTLMASAPPAIPE